MNLSVSFPLQTGIHKNIFKLKPINAHGLLLNIHNSKANHKVRFSYSCFHNNSNVVVSADNAGNFYIVDYCSCKYWGLPKLDSCTFLKFSSFHPDEILVGSQSGDIFIINYETSYICGKLEGHKFLVKDVSFKDNNNQHMCLSTSQYEAIIWDMEKYSKIQVLNLNNSTLLKYVFFIPASCYILACFQDDLIQIWNSNGYGTVKQFLPVNWKNYSIKSITFTRNGQIMVVAGYLPVLAVFQVDLWKLSKMINLPEYIHSVKQVEFISQPFDGGSNRILVILSGQGVIHFYNIEDNIMISELSSKCEVSKFSICPRGSYISCILCLGEVEVYSLELYVIPPVDVRAQKVKKKLNVQRKRCQKSIPRIKNEISNILEIEKLKMILKEYGQYPEAHRVKIWEKILQVPNNLGQYNSIINRTASKAFTELDAKYLLESSLSIRSIKKLLNNLVTWCPFFGKVEYMAGFVFPFVKLLNNKPPLCFEIVCTIILNWCQHWFEYFPLPPFNVLSIVENLIYEHDPELLYMFSVKKITTRTYAWPLLQTAFSEVLTPPEWLQFWDHVLSNEPSLLPCSVAAYSILQRDVLFSLNKITDFDSFYRNRNPVDIKRFIKLSYRILGRTGEKLHPRQYLQCFQKLNAGNYPVFIDYPKTIFDFQAEELNKLDKQLEEVAKNKVNLIYDDADIKREANEKEIIEEERRRLLEMENKCLQSLKSKQELVKRESDKLENMRNSIRNKSIKMQDRKLEKLTDEDQLAQLISVKEQYLTRLKDLLKYRYMIEDMLEQEKTLGNADNQNILEKHQKYIDKDIKNISHSFGTTEDLKKLNISTSMDILELLIGKIENDLKSDMSCEQEHSSNKVMTAENDGNASEISIKELSAKINYQQDPPSANQKNGLCLKDLIFWKKRANDTNDSENEVSNDDENCFNIEKEINVESNDIEMDRAGTSGTVMVSAPTSATEMRQVQEETRKLEEEVTKLLEILSKDSNKLKLEKFVKKLCTYCQNKDGRICCCNLLCTRKTVRFT